jgi:hypothetical protein
VNINLHIERLVLDGLTVAPGDGARIKAAVEAELSRLLTDGGIAPGLQGGIAVPSLRAGSIQMESGAKPQQLGAQIAGAVYRGIGK